MKNIALILFLSIIVFILGCNNDDTSKVPNLCNINITLNESFVVNKECMYTYISSDNDTIQIALVDIADYRDYGVVCQASTGGYAEISVSAFVNAQQKLKIFTWPGCDGPEEYNPNMSTLPELQLDKGYMLKLMKMYPLSETQDNPPSSESDYGIRLIITK